SPCPEDLFLTEHCIWVRQQLAPQPAPSVKRGEELSIHRLDRPPQMIVHSGECRLKTAMIIGRRRLAALAGTFALAPAVSRVAFAQAWPTRPVRIVVPYAPGGSTDTVAPITADRLSSIWGRQLVIENKPGAGTNIGAAAVASSDPDGYTMFVGSSSLATSRLLYHSLPYAISDLAPVTLVCTFPLLMVAPNSS